MSRVRPSLENLNVRLRSLRVYVGEHISKRCAHATCINMRELCNQLHSLSVTLRIQRVA